MKCPMCGTSKTEEGRIVEQHRVKFKPKGSFFSFGNAITALSCRKCGYISLWDEAICERKQRDKTTEGEPEICQNTKKLFPQYLKELEETKKMNPKERLRLTKWYGRKSNSDLQKRLKNGPTEVGKGCFGIILTILTEREDKGY